ncbi:MAG TPA: hypothetical protein VFT06_12590, partial [Flavisolibacter sp.]|nr:hypothetical protein [Flavisolibacter sp.]
KEYGYDCYIDQLSSANPGKQLPSTILGALKKSTAFIIIGSAGAVHSKPIGEEVVAFKSLKGNNPIIPIDIDGNLFGADWYPEIEGLAIVDEKEESFFAKQASAETLERIGNSLTFTKKSQKLRRTAYGFLLFFIVAICASVFLSLQVGKAKEELRKTSRQIRQEQLQGLIYLSKITAPVNTIAALKHAIKAYTDYRDVDTAKMAEKNLLQLYNQNNIVITNRYSTGGSLSPGGYYIDDGQWHELTTKKVLPFPGQQATRFAPDDGMAAVTTDTSVSLYRMPGTRLLERFPLKDSSGYVAFDSRNRFAFIGSEAIAGKDTAKARLRVLDRRLNRVVADVRIPKDLVCIGYAAANGGVLVLQKGDGGQKEAYTWRLPNGPLQQLPVNAGEACFFLRHHLTSDDLVLQQCISTTAYSGILKGTDYRFHVRLLDPGGRVVEDSVFVYTDIFKKQKSSAYSSTSGDFLLFGLNGSFGSSFLLNTGRRPFASPRPLQFGTFLNDYTFLKLLSEKYILAVGYKNDEYTITVFRMTSKEVQEVLTIVNKNHPNGNIEDDYFMKSIDISYCAATNFLNVYDRGEGVCTQYFLGKKPVGSATELLRFLEDEKLLALLPDE